MSKKSKLSKQSPASVAPPAPAAAVPAASQPFIPAPAPSSVPTLATPAQQAADAAQQAAYAALKNSKGRYASALPAGVTLAHTITAVQSACPVRDGSKRATRWSAFAVGRTLADAVKAGAYLRDIARYLDKGWLVVAPPASTAPAALANPQ